MREFLLQENDKRECCRSLIGEGAPENTFRGILYHRREQSLTMVLFSLPDEKVEHFAIELVFGNDHASLAFPQAIKTKKQASKNQIWPQARILLSAITSIAVCSAGTALILAGPRTMPPQAHPSCTSSPRMGYY